MRLWRIFVGLTRTVTAFSHDWILSPISTDADGWWWLLIVVDCYLHHHNRQQQGN
jgi:hypothetical protein